jgi:hypothetical protein
MWVCRRSLTRHPTYGLGCPILRTLALATQLPLSLRTARGRLSLKDDRAGHWSMRANDQFGIRFRWTSADAEDVEIVDYH